MESIDKAAVVKVLREISLLLQLKEENAFKSRAYDIGADRIAGMTEDLATVVREKRLRKLPGIGDALEEKITELVNTGRLEYFEKLKGDFPITLLDLMKVPDVGPRKARVLWQELKVGDVTALEAACRDGRVRALKGFGEKSEAKILAGIELFRRQAAQSAGRKKLGEVLATAHEFLARVQAAPGVVRAALGGSVRRFCETVSDVDIIASAAAPGPVMKVFASHPGVATVIANGDTKCSVRLLTQDLQVDLRVVPDEDFATALHHFTGSKSHHIRLRGLAQDQGLKISEWGVHRGDEKLPVPTEEALYSLLGMQFVPPEMREDSGEVEAALAGTLPKELLRFEQVMGIVHSHSTWSDGKHSLQDMALAAQALGMHYLTVTDHSQAAFYARGLKPDDLKRQWEEIDRINETLSTLRLLRGSEVDILEDGTLDFPEELLAQLEVVIASIHVRHQMNEEQMTQRVLTAFENPHLHILGHPTGRLINNREPYGLKMEAVLDKAAEKGIVIEVNGSPNRMDIKAEYVRLALQRGVKLVVSTDAHSTSELSNNTYSVGTARKGWATAADVLNTLPVERFTETLKHMRR